MSKPEDKIYGSEEQYIDDLIRLVYKQDRLREEKEIIKKSEEPITSEQKIIKDRIRERMQVELDKADQQKAKAKRKSKIFRILPKIMEIAACLILVAAIGTTVAIAKDASFRSAIMQLLINIDQEEGVADIRFEENTDESFEVPSDWRGEYYLSRIPDGFSISYIDSDPEMPAVEYSSQDGREIHFDENSYNTIATQGIEETDYTEIMINDRLALMISDDNQEDLFYRITWSNDEKWSMLETVHMTKEETLELVKSVRKIIPRICKKHESGYRNCGIRFHV